MAVRRLLLYILGVVVLAASAACGSSPTSPSRDDVRLSLVTPSSGSTTTSTPVTITGSGFGPDATVTVAGVSATSVVVQSSTTLTALVGTASASGPAEVRVASGGRSAAISSGFRFVAPSGSNRPPVIAGFVSVGTRHNQPSAFADVGELLTISANVSDAETAPSNLTFAWSGPGSFVGGGSSVSWTAPTTSTTAGVSLVVTERYDEGGVTHANVVSGTFPVRVHDSQREILDMGEDFLTLFTRNEVPTDQVLHNFSTTCDGGRGRRDEASDTSAARIKYQQDFSKFRITRTPPATFNFGSACLAFGSRIRPADACSLFTVHWEFTYRVDEDGHKAGDHGVTDGTDHVTAVLENGEWRLCHSDFQAL